MAATSELDKYDYELPKHLIAQEPLANRDRCAIDGGRSSAEVAFRISMCAICRNCYVPAIAWWSTIRALCRRDWLGCGTTTGRWEGLFLSTEPSGAWQILCKARGKLMPGETIQLLDRMAAEDVQLRLVAKSDDGVWLAAALQR